jgi:predicted RNase H-like nuclease
MFVVGVDGCRDGWVVVALEDGAFAGATQVASFSEVLAVTADASVVAVDMPIGFVERGERTCDILVREFIGPRRASVFIAPPRKALLERTYAEANAECLRRAGFGLTKQLWNLKPKIIEVEHALHEYEDAGRVATAAADDADAETKGAARKRGGYVQHGRKVDGPAALRRFARVVVPERRSSLPPLVGPRVIEVHPEASFRELAGAPLRATKKTYDGMMLRLELLASAGIELPKQLAIGRVAVDDVLDAAAAAWTANRHALGAARSLPGPEVQERDGDRVIAIWV